MPEAFGAYGEHRRLELRFDDVIEPAPDKIMPGEDDVARILAFGRSLAEEPGARLLVHCHAGISRSTAAMLLILAQSLPDQKADALVETVHGIREKAWPNLRLVELGDAMLQRRGSLVRQVHELHRLQLQLRPHLAEFMRAAGRDREVTAALALA